MIAWLLTRPSFIISAVLIFLAAIIGSYLVYTHNKLNQLNKLIIEQNIQIAQNSDTIKQLDSRLKLVQELNNNFNLAVNNIREQQALANKALSAFNLRTQSIKDPKQTSIFITNRTNDVFQGLNTLSHGAKQ